MTAADAAAVFAALDAAVCLRLPLRGEAARRTAAGGG